MSSGNEVSPAPFRVAFVTGGLKLGGSTTFLCNIAGELVKRNIPCEVFSFESLNPLSADFSRLGVFPKTCDDRSEILEDSIAKILAGLAEFRPSVVVACLGPSSFEILRYVPKGVLRAGMCQSDDPNVYRLLKTFLPWVDHFVGVSEHIAALIGQIEGVRKDAVHYLPYGVPMLEPVYDRRDTASDRLRILYLGRLEQAQKRVRLFPQILAALQASGIPFQWTIAGDGPERGYLESSMKPTDQGRVVFAGAVAYNEVPRVLQEHDIFLLASDFEGLPLSLLEAMGAGVVPVVSDIPSGVRQVIDSSTGYLIPPDDVEGYARPMVHLHGHREELAEKSRQCRQRVKAEFSVEAMTSRWTGEIFSLSNGAEVSWKKPRKILPPLGGADSFKFSGIGRALRRVRKKWAPEKAF